MATRQKYLDSLLFGLGTHRSNIILENQTKCGHQIRRYVFD